MTYSVFETLDMDFSTDFAVAKNGLNCGFPSEPFEFEPKISVAAKTTAAVAKKRMTWVKAFPFVLNIGWPVLISGIYYVAGLLPGAVISAYVLGCLTTVLSLAMAYRPALSPNGFWTEQCSH